MPATRVVIESGLTIKDVTTGGATRTTHESVVLLSPAMVIVAVPVPMAVTKPEVLTAATYMLELVQTAGFGTTKGAAEMFAARAALPPGTSVMKRGDSVVAVTLATK